MWKENSKYSFDEFFLDLEKAFGGNVVIESTYAEPSVYLNMLQYLVDKGDITDDDYDIIMGGEDPLYFTRFTIKICPLNHGDSHKYLDVYESHENPRKKPNSPSFSKLDLKEIISIVKYWHKDLLRDVKLYLEELKLEEN